MSYVVYKIVCSANGKLYVGYTRKTAEQRFAQHLNNARWRRKSALYDAMRTYGADAFTVETIGRFSSHIEACLAESCLIREVGSLAPSGYNLTYGGDGVPLTREQIDAASAKKRGKFTAKQREAADRRRGTKLSAETRAKLSAARQGRKQSAEWVSRRTAAIKATFAAQRAAGPRVWSTKRREAEQRRRIGGAP